MSIYVFGLYKDFKCIADKCKATCCSGWKIVVDREAYAGFKKIKDSRLREDILSNIVENNGVLAFKNKAGGKCAMLDEDGLCRIQRNTDEKTLCNTCRKYPRLSLKNGEDTLLSMAASCPVVIGYLCCHNNIIWYEMGTDKKLYQLSPDRIPGLSDEIHMLEEVMKKADEKVCELFYDFADIALDLIINCNDCIYLDGSFEFYEEQMDEVIFEEKYNEFVKSNQKELFCFEKNYGLYRILTGRYERSAQSVAERIYQIAGEIIMNRVIMLSLSQNKNKGFQSNIVQSVHWVYKTAVHGEKSGGIMHKKILEKLSQ